MYRILYSKCYLNNACTYTSTLLDSRSLRLGLRTREGLLHLFTFLIFVSSSSGSHNKEVMLTKSNDSILKLRRFAACSTDARCTSKWHSHSWANTHCYNSLFFAIPRNQSNLSYAYDNIKLVGTLGRHHPQNGRSLHYQ